MEHTNELVSSVIQYNNNLDEIANKILNLKIALDKHIKMHDLYELKDKLSVINNLKSRKETERLLNNVINEYGYMLEIAVRGNN